MLTYRQINLFFKVTHFSRNWNNGSNASSFLWNLNNSSANSNRNISAHLLCVKYCEDLFALPLGKTHDNIDHWLKEVKGVKYVIRYMDDIIIFHNDKKWLHQLRRDIEEYLWDNLKLELKENYQVFPSRTRGVDFVGYKHFRDYILLRKSTAKRFKRKMRKILKKVKLGQRMSHSDWCSINSYKGWVMWCNGYNLSKKYIKPLEPYAEKYYREVILGESAKFD